MECVFCSAIRGNIQDDGLIAFQRDGIAFGLQLRQVVQYDLSNLRREGQSLGLGFVVSDDEQGLRSARPVVGHDAVLVLEDWNQITVHDRLGIARVLPERQQTTVVLVNGIRVVFLTVQVDSRVITVYRQLYVVN